MSLLKETEYGAYYGPYVNNVGTSDIAKALKEGQVETALFFNSLEVSKQEYRYDTGKWTPKEILLHLIDCERVFMYRAMQIARSNETDLEGFDQDEFVVNSNANDISMESLIKEFNAVRSASIMFIDNASEQELLKTGRASNNPLSVRAAAYITRGHEMHHIAVIKDRYL